jgi:hypothetical protein
MKRIIALTSLLLLANLCYSQGFDREMIKAGKEFHKNSNNASRGVYKKSKKSKTNANRAKRKNKRKFKNRNPGV